MFINWINYYIIFRIAVLLSSDKQALVYEVKIHKLRVYERLNGQVHISA